MRADFKPLLSESRRGWWATSSAACQGFIVSVWAAFPHVLLLLNEKLRGGGAPDPGVPAKVEPP